MDSNDSVSEKVQEVKEKVTPVLHEHLEAAKQTFEVRNTINPVQVLTCVATVGILFTTRKHLKFAKRVVKNMDNNMVETQKMIVALKKAGQTFTFYPGIGIWVD